MRTLVSFSVLTGLAMGSLCRGEIYDWQEDYARVTETGDIQWTPREFRFVAGKDVRYIDFEKGSDADDGRSPQKPWKHHPWDARATAVAAGETKADTYVFKGGTVYRGQLMVKGEGRPGSPLRLTRDPAWGEGAAILAGSEQVTDWSRGAGHPQIPDGEAVWKAALDFTPRTLWMIDRDGKSLRIPLARTPNWTSQPEDHKKEWYSWSNETHLFKPKKGFSANDSINLKGLEMDFVKGALIYSEFGWVMGTPYPCRVGDYDPADGSVRFDTWTGGGNAEIIARGMRYYLEDKPQYLDDPNGEFWFEKKGSKGVLYVRLPGGIDPNTVRLEAGKRSELIVGSEARHVEISGLDFRWTTQPWPLEIVAWDSRTIPYTLRPESQPACIRIWGKGEGLRVAHCVFEDVVMGIRMSAVGEGSSMRDIRVEDNVFRNTDVGAAHFSDGTVWGLSHPVGVLDDVRLYRNFAQGIGFRATRFERGCAFDVKHPRRAHIAGNVIERSGAQAINVFAGKGSVRGDVPLVRILIHQNKAWKTMQNGNDFGGIETWGHGPVYTFNNLSFDARGQREGGRLHSQPDAGFGHAYYLDGGFKNYLFNNIAWGLSNDPQSPLANCSAFQEIVSFQNTFFNNTAYNFYIGSRRQAPQGGRNKYLGNVWQGMREFVFRHADPARTRDEGNARDAGPKKSQYALETNAYAGNVFHDIGKMGVLEPSGRWLETLDPFREVLRERRSMASEVGVIDAEATLRDPARGDFRLNRGSAGVDGGAVALVPWSLYGVVAEWHFSPVGEAPGRIIDEHWRANDYLSNRDDFHERPTHPLTTVNVEAGDYVESPLENFAKGALRFTPSRKTYARLAHSVLTRPHTARLATRAQHNQDPEEKSFTFEGPDLKNPEIHDTNFLIEAFFKAEGDGLIVGKQQKAGYRLLLAGGRAVFQVSGGDGSSAELVSQTALADGRWHHLVVEADRAARTLAIYVDGKLDRTGPGIGAVSLANTGDLLVGGGPGGEILNGALDFLRIAQGTLADAQTSIGELYAWQFDGPAMRDMRGMKPLGKQRDAGALESY
jgi:hypothetical protein